MFFVFVLYKINPQPFLWLFVSCICPISISIQSENLIHFISKLNREVTYENI